MDSGWMHPSSCPWMGEKKESRQRGWLPGVILHRYRNRQVGILNLGIILVMDVRACNNECYRTAPLPCMLPLPLPSGVEEMGVP